MPIFDQSWALYYDVRTYGARGDGVTNDYAAVQAAIDACNTAGGGTVYLPPGTYLVSTPLAIKSKVRLLGAGLGSIIQKNDGAAATGTAAIQGFGSTGTTVALNANAAYGATTITAATNPATLVAGDFVLIRDNTFTNGAFGRNQELNRIRSVSGTGPFTFTTANRLIGNYATASSAEVLKITPIDSARIQDLQVYVPGNAPTSIVQGGGCIYFDLTYDCQVTNVDLRGAYTMPGLRADRSAHLEMTYVDIRDGQDITNGSGYGYGINIGESSHDCAVSHSYMENIRENDFTNNARNCIFANNVIRRTEIHAIATHGSGGGRLVISNNNVHGSGQDAISLSVNTLGTDTDILISGNYIEDYRNYAVLIGASAGGSNDLTAVNVVGNYFGACAGTGDGYQVGVGEKAKQVAIRSNTFDNTNGGTLNAGLLVNSNASAANVVDVVVEGNDFRNITGMGIYLGKATRTIIRNNHFTAVSSYNIDSATLGGGIGTLIYGNTADDAVYNRLTTDRWWGNTWGSSVAVDGEPVGQYAPGSYTIPTGNYVLMPDNLTMTGTDPFIIEGTGQLKVFD